jgi:ferredoxin
MVRKIIKINNEKCDGCGLCVTACHEGAIGLVDGKAKLLRDDYCDGLGDCLPVCPAGAITFDEREGLAYDEAVVKANIKQPETLPCGCPGTTAKGVERANATETEALSAKAETHLNQWPVQIKLVPVNAAYFENANLLVAADCAAYAYGNFHREYMRNRITLIGCPKLDEADYSEKLTAILKNNSIKSVIVARMEVPCCGGIEHAVKTALQNCGKLIPWQVVTISTNGRIIDN